jgi:hypothetical protein
LLRPQARALSIGTRLWFVLMAAMLLIGAWLALTQVDLG